MSDALLDATTVDIEAGGTRSGAVYDFRSTGSVIKFPGFRRLYLEDRDDVSKDKDADAPLPVLEKADILDSRGVTPTQHFTQPPPRFTEASLVRALEEQGIGRPSTYAPTIATVLARDYARKDRNRLMPTKLGIAVSGLLTQHFPDIMDVGFTARVEEELDDIASGEREWTPVLKEFYGPFNEAVKLALEKAERVPRDQIDEESDEVCDECERPMVIKSGRFGRFLSCSGFPDCRSSKPLMQRTGVDCPEDGGELVERQGRGKGRGPKKFYGCTNYPGCTFTSNQRPLPQPCPDCGKLLVASGRQNARCGACGFKGPIPEEEVVELAS
jgi:DNA topoisomerase-1